MRSAVGGGRSTFVSIMCARTSHATQYGVFEIGDDLAFPSQLQLSRLSVWAADVRMAGSNLLSFPTGMRKHAGLIQISW